MSTPSANTRSRSSARSRSKSPVPPFAHAPTRIYGSRSVSPSQSTPPPTASKTVAKTPVEELRSSVVAFLQEHPHLNDPKVQKDFKDKLEEYAQTDGANMDDVLLQFGALSCGANVRRKFKVVLIGDGGVGKTALIDHLVQEKFVDKYVASQGANVTNVFFWAKEGHAYHFEMWDCAGCEKTGGIGSGYYINADAAIVMFDLLSSQTYKHAKAWYTEFTRVSQHGVAMFLGNKVDIKDRKVKAKQISLPRKQSLPYYDVSVKTGMNVTKAFQKLVRVLTNDNTFTLVSRSSQQSPNCDSDDVKRAANAPLPKADKEGL